MASIDCLDIRYESKRTTQKSGKKEENKWTTTITTNDNWFVSPGSALSDVGTKH